MAVTVQEVVADVGLQHGLPLLAGVGGGQALEGRQAKPVSANAAETSAERACFLNSGTRDHAFERTR